MHPLKTQLKFGSREELLWKVEIGAEWGKELPLVVTKVTLTKYLIGAPNSNILSLNSQEMLDFQHF